jgi:hypothetical protein
VYRISVDEETQEQVAALPTDLLPHYAEALDVLMMAPWTDEPYNPDKPLGAMRRLVFGPEGRGEVIYVVVEDQQHVSLLRIYWF